MTQGIQSLKVRLDSRGYRLTAPRSKILEMVLARGDPFTAEELYRDVPLVGRATVYRTVKLMVKLGILCKVALEDGAPRYRLGPLSHHHHLVCVVCEKVQDFARCSVDDIVLRLSQATGHQIVGHRIEVYGVCPSCQDLQAQKSVYP